MYDKLKALLYQYGAKFKQTWGPGHSKKVARSSFDYQAGIVFVRIVRPVLVRLEHQLKAAGHDAWVHEDFWISEDSQRDYSNVELYCRLKTVTKEVDGDDTLCEGEAPGVRFIADLDKLAVVVVARLGPSSQPRGFSLSTTHELPLAQISTQKVEEIAVEWLLKQIEPAGPKADQCVG
jgi:hypothetical protein